MDITKYDSTIQALYAKQKEYLQLMDPRVFDILNKLLKKANNLKDEELIGYTYHSLAFANYFVKGDYDAFLNDLSHAAKHLLKEKDSSEILHVYYLIAIDALNKGAYDISYQYFLTARNVANRSKLKTSAAILNENIAHTLMLIGDYKQARTFLKKSLAGIKMDPSHPHYYNNVVSCYINDADACLHLDLINEAEKNYNKTKKFIDANTNAFQLDAYINFALLGARIAIRKKNTQLLENRLKVLFKYLKKLTQAANYVNDINTLVNELLAIKQFNYVKKIINILSKKEISSDAINAKRIFNETKISYYTATKQNKKLLESYLEQETIITRITQEHANNTHSIQELITFTNSLQKQQEEITLAHIELEKDANTDALTGIANRYKMNKLMDDAFEDAYHNNKYFAVGILDLDRLKDYNDKYGHQAGDQLLIDFSKSLSSLTDKHPIEIARYGGDEFLVLFKNMNNKDIKAVIKDLHNYTDIEFSIGICRDKPKLKQKVWDYMSIADKELYKIKNTKKKNTKNKNIDISISSFK